MNQDLHDACVAAAEAGAQVLRELFHKPREIAFKGRIDLVTDADRASEEAVLRVLGERAPGVRILAEESGAHGGSGEARFIVDPLDGTTNYAHGIPLFACTVAVEVSGAVVACCTIDPLRGELFHALRGKGAFVRLGGSGDNSDRALHASVTRELSQAVVCTGFPYDRREKLPAMMAAFARFTERSRATRRLGSAALDLAYVGAGRFDGFYEQGLKPWDVAAGHLLVEEAGGLVTRYDGAEHSLAGGEILAAGAGLHAAMLQVLQS